MLRKLVPTLLAGSVLLVQAQAQLIDFESIPGFGAPVDGMSISNQFESSAGVSFSLENGGSPVIAQVGDPRTAFQGFNSLPDQPAPDVPAGQFFLTDDGFIAGPPETLIVTYSSPVRACSGILIDIDGTEEFTVFARGATGSELEHQVLFANNQLDGSGTLWSFDRAQQDIYSIRIAYTGSQTSGVGLAFDHFSVSTVPEPSTVLAMSFGLLCAWRKQRIMVRKSI